MKNVANVVMARMRYRNQQMKVWAKDHGFYYDTVMKTIYGQRGVRGAGESARIIEALKKDGLWPDEPPEATDPGGNSAHA